MRCLYVFICCIIFYSCKANQKLLSERELTKSCFSCPEDGICSFEVLYNKSMTLLNDGIGELYPEISEGNNIILKFEYKRKEIPNTVDGHYSELIYMELEQNNLLIELENSHLKEVNLLFARWCFCKGQTGYYKVNKGKLTIIKEENDYRLELEFKIDEVPQIITSINKLFSIEQ